MLILFVGIIGLLFFLAMTGLMIWQMTILGELILEKPLEGDADIDAWRRSVMQEKCKLYIVVFVLWAFCWIFGVVLHSMVS